MDNLKNILFPKTTPPPDKKVIVCLTKDRMLIRGMVSGRLLVANGAKVPLENIECWQEEK
jgi:hypothetical protein